MNRKLILFTIIVTIILVGCGGDSSKNESSDKSSVRSSSSNSKISSYDAKRLAEKYIGSNPLLHGHMGLDYYSNLSNPDNGVFAFYGAVCYGSSEYDCNYESVYLTTSNNGRTWSIEF